MHQPPPNYPPPRRSRTNAVIIGSAAALIVAIVGTGVYVAQSRDDGSGRASAGPTSTPSVAASAPEASPSVSVSPECRTWIKAELLDDSEEIDATPGYNACGGLSDDELQAAIDQVTEELTAEITPEP
jgi:hypothetical protein